MNIRASLASLLVVLITVGVVAAKAGPNTALRLAVVEPGYTLSLGGGKRLCPPSFSLNLATNLADAGTSLVLDRVTRDAARSTITIDLTVKRDPNAVAPQIITAAKVAADIGSLRKGRYIVVIRQRFNNSAYKIVQSTVLDGR